jgi:molybdate transport system substrate-binding protein
VNVRSPVMQRSNGRSRELAVATCRGGRAGVTSLVAAVTLGCWAGVAGAADIRVMYPPPMRTVLAELLPRFERISGHHIVATFTPSAAIVAGLAGGESADVEVLTVQAIDDLVRQGKLDAASRVALARSRIGVAVRAGTPQPDIPTKEAFRRALVAAKSFARNDGADSGIFMAGLIERLGIAAEMKPKTTLVRSGFVAELVARGEVDMAAQQMAELMAVPGVAVTPLPDEIAHVIVFAAAMPAATHDAQAARELMRFLASPDNAPVYEAKGHQPM